MNQRRIVEVMARLGKASRVELARASGISQPTVTRIVDDLLSQNILMQAIEAAAKMRHGFSLPLHPAAQIAQGPVVCRLAAGGGSLERTRL